MFSPMTPTRKPFSGRRPPAFSMSALPDDLVIEILTRLSGKQIGRCRCVSKPWRTLIGSRFFLEICRKRQRGLLLYWPEVTNEADGVRVYRLRLFHCPFRRLEEPRPEFSELDKFSPLRELRESGRAFIGGSQVVNGLICVGEADYPSRESNVILTIHNICTGEMMRVSDDPLPYVKTNSTYHIGYDPTSRVYKLLRLIISKNKIKGAHIMTLRAPSSGSPSTWRELDNNAAGICDLHLSGLNDNLIEVRISPDNGILCWRRIVKSNLLLWFDLNKERFHITLSPEKDFRLGAVTRFEDSLTLWYFISKRRGISYVQGNDNEGEKNWSKHRVDIVKELNAGASRDDCLSFFSSGEMLLENPDEFWLVYPYTHRYTQHEDKAGLFIVGKFPDGVPDLDQRQIRLKYRWKDISVRSDYSSRGLRTSCFTEGNNTYLSLDDVFGGGAAVL